MIQGLPEKIDPEEMIKKIHFLKSVSQGLDDVKNKRSNSLEVVREKFKKCIK